MQGPTNGTVSTPAGISWTVRLSIQHPAGGSFLEVVCSSRLYTSVILNFKECAHIPCDQEQTPNESFHILELMAM